VFRRVGAWVFPLHPAVNFQLAREAQPEAIEKNGLVVGGASDAAAARGNPRAYSIGRSMLRDARPCGHDCRHLRQLSAAFLSARSCSTCAAWAAARRARCPGSTRAAGVRMTDTCAANVRGSKRRTGPLSFECGRFPHARPTELRSTVHWQCQPSIDWGHLTRTELPPAHDLRSSVGDEPSW